MCRCAREADRLDSLKPRSTVNDVSDEIGIVNGVVDLRCTRFRTRIRESGSQVRPTFRLHLLIRAGSDGVVFCGL